MMKRFTAIALCFVLIVLLSSCDRSIKKYTDENGNTFDIYPDETGNIAVNESGQLKVYVLSEEGKRIKDENGEYRTAFVDFNGQVVEGRRCETVDMRLKIPSGFVQSYSTGLLFLNDKFNSDVFISVFDDSDLENEIRILEQSCARLLDSYGSDRFSYDTYKLDMKNAGVTAAVYVLHCTAPDYPKTDYCYYFEYDGLLYCVNASIDSRSEGKVDFDAFVKSIEFK